MILSILDQLAATTKRTEKEAILAKHKRNSLLMQVIAMSYNPFANYYIKPSYNDMISNKFENHLSAISLLEALDLISTRILDEGLRGNAAKEFVREVYWACSQDDAEVILRVLNKDIRVGCSESTFNKIWKGLVPTFTLMACESLNEKTEKLVKKGWYAQMKHDGARVAIVYDGTNVTFYSRNGKDYNMQNQNLIDYAMSIGRLYGPYVIDGEMLQINTDGSVKDRKTSNGVATKMIRGTCSQAEYNNCIINAWDMIPLAVFKGNAKSNQYKERLELLHEALGDNDYIRPEKLQVINSVEEGRAIAKQYMQQGFEGAILKDPKGLWQPKRAKTQLKVKAIQDADLRVYDIVEGTGKYAGMLGAVRCKNDEGNVLVDVGSGFKDAERKFFWENPKEIIDKVVAVEYNELIQSRDSDTHSLFLPIFIEVRDDKDETDTLQKLKESK